MFTAQAHIRVRAPREELWELVADPREHLVWRSELVEMELEEGEPATVGAVYREVLEVGPSTIVSRFRIRELDAPHRFVFETFEPDWIPSTNTIELRPAGDATHVVFVSENRTRGWRTWLDPVWLRLFERSMRRELVNLRDVVEAQEHLDRPR